MPITVKKENDQLFVAQIDGVLTYDDLKAAEKSFTINDQKAKVLIIAENFSGWGKDGDWGDLTFMYEHDPYIEKIAIVADENWHEQILMFLGAGRRQAQVKSFYTDEIDDARDWLINDN